MRSKDIGTRAETFVVKYLRETWPEAERLVLAGSEDQGDIGHCGDFVFEVKAGAQTKTESQVAGWLEETKREARHRGVPWGVLITQRHGYGQKRVDRWWAWVDATTFAQILGIPITAFIPSPPPLRLELGDLIYLAGAHGAI